MIFFGGINISFSEESWIGRDLGWFSAKVLKIDAPSLKKYKITSVHEEKNEIAELVAQNSKTKIFLEIYNITSDFAEFENFKKANLTIVKNLYRRTASPYPGSVSNTFECQEKKYYPKEYEVKNKEITFSVFEGGASSRYTMGECTPNEAKYEGILIFFKTKSNYYQMKIFIPFDEYLKNKNFAKNLLQSLTCHF